MLSVSLALLLAARGSSAEPMVYQIDESSSTMAVEVGKAGLFSFAGHDHRILVTSIQGQVVADPERIEASELELQFPSSGLRVDPEEEPPGDAPKVQEAMQGPKCLDVTRYPEIRFRSTKVAEQEGDSGDYVIELSGELDLHGVKQALRFPVRVQIRNGRLTASGKVQIKQKDFGIDPISVAGGTIKVKNELTIEFTLHAKATAASHEGR
ncbi:MAG TPA: YceI family protein [Acidobacteriota bacterium]